MIKKIWDSFVAWLGKKLRRQDKLKEKDFEQYGFIKVIKQGNTKKFNRDDEYSLKWNYHKNTVTIRLGRALRFFGVVETPKELKWVMSRTL